MANKRMFSKSIVGSDAFMDMPPSTRELYFQLGMEADDDGFIGNPKRIVKGIGATDNDYDLLKAKKFVLVFPSGVLVIKHHRINNNWDKYNCKRTSYIEEFNQLFIKENMSYTVDNSQGVCVQTDNRLLTVSRREEKRREYTRTSKDVGNLTNKKKKMKKNSFNYSEKNTSDSYEDVIDLDSGEKVVEKPKSSKKVIELVEWAENRRGAKFMSRPKQYKAINLLKSSGNITPEDIKRRWIEMENDNFWKEKGFDFMAVFSSFERKPIK